jgi:hypothetical protein
MLKHNILSAPLMHRPVTLMHRPAPLMHRPAPLMHRPVPLMHRPAPLIHRPAPLIHRPVSLMHRPVPLIHLPAMRSASPCTFNTSTCNAIASPCNVNTARLRIFVGWVEALRNPTNPAKCWVSFLNPTYTFLFFRLNRAVLHAMLLHRLANTINRLFTYFFSQHSRLTTHDSSLHTSRAAIRSSIRIESADAAISPHKHFFKRITFISYRPKTNSISRTGIRVLFIS